MGNQRRRKIQPTAVPKVKPEQALDDFINACLAADPSTDMRTILDKKIKKHFLNCDPAFASSSSCRTLLQNFTTKVKSDKSNVFVYIKEAMDELKARKGSSQNDCSDDIPPASKRRKTNSASIDYNAVDEARKEQKIKKLSRTLSKLEKMIKQLESKEVDWEDDGDSSYIMLQRFKDRAVKVFKKLCEYTQESKGAGAITKIHFTGTPLPRVNKCVQSYVNTTGQFPDYLDILDVIEKANEEDNLKLSAAKLKTIAEQAFQSVGEELQRQRMHGVEESLLSLLDNHINDPADDDEELRAKLQENKKNWQKIDEVIDEFATRSVEPEPESDSEDGKGTEDDSEEEEDENELEEDIEPLSSLSASDKDEKCGSTITDENSSEGDVKYPTAVASTTAEKEAEPSECDTTTINQNENSGFQTEMQDDENINNGPDSPNDNFEDIIPSSFDEPDKCTFDEISDVS